MQREENYGVDHHSHAAGVYRRVNHWRVAHSPKLLQVILDALEGIMPNNGTIFIETDAHVIEVSEGCLTIGTKIFPDNCVSLSLEETEEVLRLLLRRKHSSN